MTAPDLPPDWQALLAMSDFHLMETQVPPPARLPPQPAPKNGHYPLKDHILTLQRAHVGKPMVALLHAALIVLIRREIAQADSLARYFDIWDRHGDELCAVLNARWLISAADTFADHGRTSGERALGLCGSVLMNLIKLQETERLVLGQPPLPDNAAFVPLPATLFDGLMPFRIGSGDLVANLRDRMARVCEGQGPAGRIVMTLMARANTNVTILGRLSAVHENPETEW